MSEVLPSARRRVLPLPEVWKAVSSGQHETEQRCVGALRHFDSPEVRQTCHRFSVLPHFMRAPHFSRLLLKSEQDPSLLELESNEDARRMTLMYVYVETSVVRPLHDLGADVKVRNVNKKHEHKVARLLRPDPLPRRCHPPRLRRAGHKRLRRERGAVFDIPAESRRECTSTFCSHISHKSLVHAKLQTLLHTGWPAHARDLRR